MCVVSDRKTLHGIQGLLHSSSRHLFVRSDLGGSQWEVVIEQGSLPFYRSIYIASPKLLYNSSVFALLDRGDMHLRKHSFRKVAKYISNKQDTYTIADSYSYRLYVY
jgi:hypothetical protein